MGLISPRSILVALYLGNVVLSIATTIAIIRLGQDLFTLTWCLGALMALSWGTTGYGLADPTLSARIWSVPVREAVGRLLWPGIIGMVALAVVCTIPATATWIAHVAGIPSGWVAVFVAVGLVRGMGQVAIVFSFRLGQHRAAIVPQIVGRVLEFCLVVLACLWGNAYLLPPAMLLYPASQFFVFMQERHQYADLPTVDAKRSDAAAWLLSAAGNALQMVLPAVWLKFGGEAVFVAFRAIGAAVANSVLVPRYWFEIIGVQRGDQTPMSALAAVTVVSSLVMALAYQVLTDAVPVTMMLWAIVPILVNSITMVHFSRWRQLMLKAGTIAPPAAVASLGCIVEIALVVGLSQLNILPNGALLLANAGVTIAFVGWLGLSSIRNRSQ